MKNKNIPEPLNITNIKISSKESITDITFNNIDDNNEYNKRTLKTNNKYIQTIDINNENIHVNTEENKN